MDKSIEYFCEMNMLLSNKNKYVEYWYKTSYRETYTSIRKTVTCTKGPQRKINMYLFGSTIGRTNYPCYYDKDGYHNLPRPYAHYKPKSIARQTIDRTWFTEFVSDIEKAVIYFLRQLYPYSKKAKMTLFYMELSKKVIPMECRICGSCFNHMTMLGNLKYEVNSEIKAHIDEEDIVTALFHIGEPKSGGSTLYFDGVSSKNKGKIQHVVPFQHGRLQVGFFNETVHAAGEWEGIRGGINLNLKRNVLRFFQNKELSKYYDQYKRAGFPSDNFVAI